MVEQFYAKKFVVIGYYQMKPGYDYPCAIPGALVYKGLVDGRKVFYVEANDNGAEYEVSMLWGHVTPLVGAKVVATSSVQGQQQPINLLTQARYAVVRRNKELLICYKHVWRPVSKEVLVSFDILGPSGAPQDFRPPQLTPEQKKKFFQMVSW